MLPVQITELFFLTSENCVDKIKAQERFYWTFILNLLFFLPKKPVFFSKSMSSPSLSLLRFNLFYLVPQKGIPFLPYLFLPLSFFFGTVRRGKKGYSFGVRGTDTSKKGQRHLSIPLWGTGKKVDTAFPLGAGGVNLLTRTIFVAPAHSGVKVRRG